MHNGWTMNGHGFNPLNRGGDIHTMRTRIIAILVVCFNPLNRGGDIHTK